MNFSNTLIRASALGKIMTEAKDKATKDAGGLSQTAKTYLKELYVEKLWGVSKDLFNKYCEKGKLVEDDSIHMLSILDSRLYYKNDEQLSDEYFCGEPDVFAGEEIRKAEAIRDVKSSWDAWSFIAKMGEPLDKTYWCQMQVYLHLTGCKSGSIDYCLVSTPQVLIESEKRKIFYAMNPPTEENIEYKKVIAEMERNASVEHIPMQQRRIHFPVQYDPAFIESAIQKVKKCREYLAELHELHLNPKIAA